MTLCLICLETIVNPFTFKCTHEYCRNCLQLWFNHDITNNKTKFKCMTCDYLIERNEVSQLVDAQTLDKYDKFVLNNLLDTEFNLFRCGNCPAIVSVDQNTRYFACQECKKEYCCICQVEWHKGITCNQWANQHGKSNDLTLNLISKLNVKQCPKCKMHIEKNDGCDHMTCGKCKYEFWWSSLQDYKTGKSSWVPPRSPAQRNHAPIRLIRHVPKIKDKLSMRQASNSIMSFRQEHESKLPPTFLNLPPLKKG